MKLLMLILALLVSSCTPVGTRTPLPVADGVELPAYGESEDIIVHIGYTASYNHTTLIPDWVAWELTAEEVAGNLDGQFSFSWDPAVRSPRASREDYSNSGYDKGHMAPRADMKWSHQALEESYFFTNICPQDHTMNAEAWRKIESLTRRAANRYGSVLVVCGPVFDSVNHRHIGPACVHVPDRFFKALAVNTANGWQTVGFLMENNSQTGSPRSYAVAVDSVEATIGRDLFPSLPEECEADFDWKIWNK